MQEIPPTAGQMNSDSAPRFVRGNVVALVSGGRWMTVERCYWDSDEQTTSTTEVVWLDEYGIQHRDTFATDMLDVISRDPK